MRGKVVSISAWLSLILICSGLILGTLQVKGSIILLILSVFITTVVFIPAHFFFRDSQNDFRFGGFLIKILFGISFQAITLYVFWARMHWPFTGVLGYMSVVGYALIAILLFRLKEPKIERPQVIALQVVVCLTGLFIPIGALGARYYETSIVPFDEQVGQHISSHHRQVRLLADSNNAVYEKGRSFLDLLSYYQIGFLTTLEGIPVEMADTISVKYIASKSNTDIPAYYFDRRKSERTGNSMTPAEHLLTEFRGFQSLLKQGDSMALVDYVSFPLTTAPGRDTVYFSGFPAAFTVEKLNILRLYVLNEVLISLRRENGQLTSEFHRSKREKVGEIENKFNKLLQEANTKVASSRDSFTLLMAVSFLIIIFLWFIPTFPLSESWKIRILLFCVVIIFEFVLLITDFYVGIFSQNPTILLLINIVLALGLVSVDHFLRNNMLKWYNNVDPSID